MKEQGLNNLKKGFLEGELSDPEWTQLQELLREDQNPAHDELRAYFQLIESERNEDISILSKKEYFTRVEKDRNFRRTFLYAAAIIAGLIFGAIILIPDFFDTDESQMTQQEIDQSLEVTYRALSSFSSYYQEGMQELNRGMDLSRPFDPLSNFTSVENN